MSNVGTKAVRSPSYPNMALDDAVAEVGKIEGQYRTAAVDRLVAAKIIGYSSLSGPAAKALAALANYGLVERAGKGELRVTSRAVAILHADSKAEKADNLRMAAREPNLFRELQERFPDLIPPEDGVITYLNRLGFNQNAIRPATRAYLKTMHYLEEAGVSESHGFEEGDASESLDMNENPENEMQPEMQKPILATTAIGAPMATFDNSIPDDAMNKINMNIQGDSVYLSGIFDFEGLEKLEKKIAGLKALMEPEEDQPNL